MSTESLWAQALLDPAQGVPAGLTTWNHSDPERRLAVYRNNVVVSLVDALSHTFPVAQQLVGEAFFRAMAQVFVRAHPPRTRVLTHYGQAMPDFMAGFAPAASVPYLADVARLECWRLQALHAADAQALDAAAIGEALQDADTLPQLCCQMAPSLQVLQANCAAVSIWAAHQEGSGIELAAVETDVPEAALIFRSDWDVMVLQVPSGVAAFATSLLAQKPLGEAIEAAHADDPEFDLSQALALLMRHGLLVGLCAPGQANPPV